MDISLWFDSIDYELKRTGERCATLLWPIRKVDYVSLGSLLWEIVDIHPIQTRPYYFC